MVRFSSSATILVGCSFRIFAGKTDQGLQNYSSCAISEGLELGWNLIMSYSPLSSR